MRVLCGLMLGLLASSAPAQEQAAYIDDRSTPVAVVQSFYSAINRHEFARAWSYFEDAAQGGTFDEFAAGFSDTESVSVSIDESTSEGAAGSTYWTVPVRLDAINADGSQQAIEGCYILRLAQPANQTEPPFHPMHIVEG
ncbi:MAG: DUF1176 domain-containing protein, partial [Devosia sp.]